jgi:formamidopyrimidine-DNA glycosylase
MMPELPEVETIVCQLRPVLQNRVLASLTAVWAKTLEVSPADLAGLPGHHITEVSRRGKWILIHLSGGLRLAVHLRMTGRLSPWPLPGKASHLRAELSFRDGGCLYFYDARKFGRIRLVSPDQTWLEEMGVEPLLPGALEGAMSRIRTHRAVKAVLLDQTLIAGIGNIYADEALFAAGIHPSLPFFELSPARLAILAESVRRILRDAISAGGSSISDYRSLSGEEGRHQQAHRVYQRTGEPCLRCGQPIERLRIAGRSSHFCPRCQPLTSHKHRV